MAELVLAEDRFFDSDPTVKQLAAELYSGIKDLPIICPHGHVDPKLFAENRPFPDPTELIFTPDHYIFRMLYSRGYRLEDLGISALDGSPVEKDHRKIWQIFGDNYFLFSGTPTGVWLNHEFYQVFGIREKFNSDSANRIYDRIEEKLASEQFLPRSLFDRFNIEVLTTTDGAGDSLQYHKKIKESGWDGKIIPCFRPDAVTDFNAKGWAQNIKDLSRISGIEISSYPDFIHAIENRREYFKSMGAVSTDQGVYSPYTHKLSDKEAEIVFQVALSGEATQQDAARFSAHMLMEMARMSTEDGLVMQIHPGSYRNHNRHIFEKFGPDKGCDIPVKTEYTSNLYELLNRFGNDPRLRLIVFTLDESAYSRELAPLSGCYPALKLGPPWWFFDSIEGMIRFRRSVTETAGIYNTVGFNDDTRAFPSIPARHDVSRRVDCNFLAGLVAKKIIDLDDAVKMSEYLTYKLVKEGYGL